MHTLKFLIVAPKYSIYGTYYPFPIGLAYVSSSLKEHGFSTTVLNTNHHREKTPYLVKKCIIENDIDVVCTGGMSIQWDAINQVLKAAKQVKPDIITVTGGPIITAKPHLAFSNLPTDFGVIGEGEETIVEIAQALCQGADPREVDGLIYRDKGGKLIQTRPRRPVPDLDALPFPDYEGFGMSYWTTLNLQPAIPELNGLYFDENHDIKLAEILLSRSCPFNCTFCYHPLGKKYRQRSLDNVFLEIDHLVKTYRIGMLRTNDELFSINRDRIFEFARRIKPYQLPWTASWRVENVDREILEVLKESNVFYLCLGIESMSDIILKSMNKRTQTAKIKEALALGRDIGVMMGGNIIIGDPVETLDTFHESYSWLKENSQYNIRMYFILTVPDSKLYQDAVKNGLIKDELEFTMKRFPVINLTRMSNRTFHSIRRKVTLDNLLLRNFKAGEIFKVESSSKKPKIRQLTTFAVRCPHCSGETTRRHSLVTRLPMFAMICRCCYSPMKVSTRAVFKEEYNSFVALYEFLIRFIYSSFRDNNLLFFFLRLYRGFKY